VTVSLGGDILLRADDLRSFAAEIFLAANVRNDEAHVVAECLVESNLRGHDSHGVFRVMEYLGCLERGELRTGVELCVVSETASAIVCDGQLGFGPVQMQRLIARMEPMARAQGVACGTIRRCGHVGRLGEWVERLARVQLAGIMSVNDNGVLRCVAPPGGIEPRISTNPIAIGVPTADEPLVLDISTSMAANGKIRIAHQAGRPCPDGWLLDAQGQPTNDPAVRFQNPPGTIQPMGGYKGFGLGLLFDVLVGGLSGGHCPPAPDGEVECNNVLLIAFDPARFAGTPHLIDETQKLCEWVRATPRVNDTAEIRLPNDRSRTTLQERQARGVPIDRATWDQLCECAKRLRVSVPAVS